MDGAAGDPEHSEPGEQEDELSGNMPHLSGNGGQFGKLYDFHSFTKSLRASNNQEKVTKRTKFSVGGKHLLTLYIMSRSRFIARNTRALQTRDGEILHDDMG